MGRVQAGLFPDNVCLGNIANKPFPQGGFDPNLMEKKEAHSCLGQKGQPFFLIYSGRKREEY
jgi:hypothetical protein